MAASRAVVESLFIKISTAMGKRRAVDAPSIPLEVLSDLLNELSLASLVFEIPNHEGVPRFGVTSQHVQKIEEELRSSESFYTSKVRPGHLRVNHVSSSGAVDSVDVEIWTHASGNLKAPVWNPRAVLVGAEYQSNVATTLDGREYLTHPDLAQVDVLDVDFAIDVVYLWVDGDDQQWLASRAKHMGSTGEAPDAQHSAHLSRFRQADELKYSFRSLVLMPWVRNVYVVTAGQTPHWLDTAHPRVTVIDHSQIMPPDALPTFNSHAIAANIHRIEGLSEHFLYFNDDLFVGQAISKQSWFDGRGLAQVRMTRTLQPGKTASLSNPTLAARRNTIDLADAAGLLTSPRSLQHAPHPMRRSVMDDAWQRFPEEFARTTRSRFRAATDIVPEWMHNFVAFSTDRATVVGERTYRYVAVNSRDSLLPCMALAMGRNRPAVFCLNDSSEVEPSQALSNERTAARLTAVLESIYPHPSEFEKPSL